MAEAVLRGVLGILTSLAAPELGSFLGFSGEKEKLESMSLQSRLFLKMLKRSNSQTKLQRIGWES